MGLALIFYVIEHMEHLITY